MKIISLNLYRNTNTVSKPPSRKFCKCCIFMRGDISSLQRGDNKRVMSGRRKGDKILVGRKFYYRKSLHMPIYDICICKCWRYLIHENVCFMVCLNFNWIELLCNGNHWLLNIKCWFFYILMLVEVLIWDNGHNN